MDIISERRFPIFAVPSTLILHQRTGLLADVTEDALPSSMLRTWFIWPDVLNLDHIRYPSKFLVGEAFVSGRELQFTNGRHRSKLLALHLPWVPIGIGGHVPEHFRASPSNVALPEYLLPFGRVPA